MERRAKFGRRRTQSVRRRARRGNGTCVYFAGAPLMVTLVQVTLEPGAVLLPSAMPALAQSDTTEGRGVIKVEVTGSNIKRTDIESALPLQIFTRDDLLTASRSADMVRRSPSALFATAIVLKEHDSGADGT